jgi:pilus assembly protein Flp/PilA
MSTKVLCHYSVAIFGTVDLFQETEDDVTFKDRRTTMQRLIHIVLKMKVWKDNRGQDLIEYALMAGFVAVAAGAIMPGVASSINVIFSQVNSIMVTAAAS